MIRTLIAEPLDYPAEALSLLQGHGPVDEGPLTRGELIARLPDYDVVIVRLAHQIDREVLDAGGRLRCVASATTGLDHIDLAHAADRGVAVLSLRGEFEFLESISSTAELTWGLLLSLLRRIPQAAASVRAGAWDRDSFRGHDLEGKRLGIVGLGRIGRKVGRYGLAFNMSVAAYDPRPTAWTAGIERAESLEALLRRSDVLTIHVPLGPETKRLIGDRELRLLPQDAIVVNTARGGILDEEALVAHLRSGHLAGAALDVIDFEREPERRLAGPVASYIHENDNLLVTPHIGGATLESMAKAELFVARKVAVFFNRGASC